LQKWPSVLLCFASADFLMDLIFFFGVKKTPKRKKTQRIPKSHRGPSDRKESTGDGPSL